MPKKRIIRKMEIRDMLEEEMKKFDEINNELIEQNDNQEKINENYYKYNKLIDEGHERINDISNYEFYENLLVYISFKFFFGCVIYVLSTRFPIYEIIINSLHTIIMFLFKLI